MLTSMGYEYLYVELCEQLSIRSQGTTPAGQALGVLTKMAVDKRFELLWLLHQHAFQACPLSLSGNLL